MTQFVFMVDGVWHIGELPPREVVLPRRMRKVERKDGPTILHSPPRHHFNDRRDAPLIRHNPPRRHFNQKIDRPEEPVVVAPAPQAVVDKMARFDQEHAKIKYDNRSSPAMNKELNVTAFENDGYGDRPARANVGYSRIKSRGWR